MDVSQKRPELCLQTTCTDRKIRRFILYSPVACIYPVRNLFLEHLALKSAITDCRSSSSPVHVMTPNSLKILYR